MKKLAALAAAVILLPLLVLPALAATYAASSTGNPNCPPGTSIAGNGTGGTVRGSGPALAASAAAAAGFTGPDLLTAVAVAGAESSYNPLARNSVGASGLWQILQSAHPDLFARYNWRDPAQNAVMAYAVWQAAHHSWQPWTTWTSGAYLAHLPEARAAIATLTNHPDNPSTLAPPCSTVGGTPDAKPYPGGTGGCTIPDPTGTGGCITPATAWMLTQLHARFGTLPIACWSARPGDPYTDHSKGRACDITIGRIGTYPGPTDVTRGWTIATWLHANAAPLHLSYLIWQRRIWSLTHNTEGWRPYTGGGYYSTSGPTNGHYDHIHVSVTE